MSDANGVVARLSGVSHRYGATPALDAIDLDIPAGCMAGVIGPDGVGKSTLLALIAGARKIQAGAVEVLGGDLRSRRFRAQVAPRIAYMPQGLGGNLYADALGVRQRRFFRPPVRSGRATSGNGASTNCSRARAWPISETGRRENFPAA